MGRRRAVIAVVALGALVAAAAWGGARLRVGGDGAVEAEHGDARPPSLADGAGPAAASAPGGALAARPRAATPPPAADELSIVGRVVDVDGQAVADARVLAAPAGLTATFSLADVGGAGLAVGDAVTGADGRFSVALRGGAVVATVLAFAPDGRVGSASDVPAGREVDVVVVATGAIAGTVVARDGTPVPEARVRLTGALDVLRLDVETTADARGAFRLAPLPVLPRGAVFEPASLAALVEVTAEGYAPLVQPGSPYPTTPGGVVERTFVLARGSVLEGTVLYAASKAPVAGARVVLWSIEGNGTKGGGADATVVALPRAERVVAETTSGPDGAFRFERVPCLGFHAPMFSVHGRAGPLIGNVTAVAEGCAPSSASVAAVAEGDRQGVTLEVWRAAVVVGRVVDTTGAPVVADVAQQAPEGRGLLHLPAALFPDARAGLVRTDPQGRYRLVVPTAAVAETPEGVTLGATARASARAGGDPRRATATVEVRAGETVAAPDLVVDADPAATGARVCLRVVDVEGRPVVGARVEPITPFEAAFAVRTGPDGQVLLPSLGPIDSGGGVTVRAAGYVPIAVRLAAGPAGSAPAVVRLPRGHRLEGRVLDATGRGIEGMMVVVVDGRVSVERALDAARSQWDRRRQWRVVESAAVEETFAADIASRPVATDADGRFAFRDLPPGPYHVLTPWESLRATSLSGVPSDTLDCTLVVSGWTEPATTTVSGTVMDAETGRAPDRLVVDLDAPNRASARQFSADAEALWRPALAPTFSVALLPAPGRFSFDGVGEGEVTLTVRAAGYAPVRRTVRVSAASPTTLPPILLVRGVVARGRLRLPAGVAAGPGLVAFSSVGVRPEGAIERLGPLAPDGRYEVTGLAPGRWRVAARSSDGVVFAADVRTVCDIAPGAAEVEFDATLAAAGRLTVATFDPRFSPEARATEAGRALAAGTEVVVRDAHGDVVESRRGVGSRDADERFAAISVPAGTYTVRVSIPGEAPTEQTVTVDAGGGASVLYGVTPEGVTACGDGKCG